MKKLLHCFVLLFSVLAVDAQIIINKKEPQNQSTNKPLTIKPAALPTVKKPAGTTQATSQPIEKPLDLFITNLSVVATKLSGDTFKLAITYTVMNIDTTPVALSAVSMQGWVGTDPSNGQPYSGGCGATAGLSIDTLKSGSSFTNTFYCFNKKLSATGRPVYLLGISPLPGYRIVNEQKSQKRVYITL